MRVFEKGGFVVNAKLEYGVYSLTIFFDATPSPSGTNIRYG
jgi:hypothetical protein